MAIRDDIRIEARRLTESASTRLLSDLKRQLGLKEDEILRAAILGLWNRVHPSASAGRLK